MKNPRGVIKLIGSLCRPAGVVPQKRQARVPAGATSIRDIREVDDELTVTAYDDELTPVSSEASYCTDHWMAMHSWFLEQLVSLIVVS